MTSRDFQKQAITQIFLYKFLNAKFAHEVKRIDPKLTKADSWEVALRKMKKADFEMLLMQLSADEENRIIQTFNQKQAVEDFSVVVSYADIAAKNHSFSAGQYFDVKVEHVAMTPKQFEKELGARKERLKGLFGESSKLEKQIEKQLSTLSYER